MFFFGIILYVFANKIDKSDNMECKKYIIDGTKKPEIFKDMNIKNIYKSLNEENQVYVITNTNLEEYYYEILVDSKPKSSKIILDKITTLENYNYAELEEIFKKDIHIPERLLTKKLIKKITTIHNVKLYRNLINELNKNNDTSEIEIKRKEYYDYFINNCESIYNNIKKEIKNSDNPRKIIEKHLNCFGGLDKFLDNIYSNNINEQNINKSLNYITSEIIIDYIFEDYAYNVFIDIRQLLNFSQSVDILDEKQKKIYADILELDTMNIKEKQELLIKLKNINMIEKFYDSYKLGRERMVKLFNDSILNKDNIIKYKNEELSEKYNVNIYVLDGQQFKILVKSTEINKNDILNKSNLFYPCDGASFSIDGSNKLKTFSNPKIYYNLAYNNIPKEQLVHVFEVDSFSKYKRNINNIPLDSNGTDRINRLYTPDQLTDISSAYDEIIIAQPNMKNDEFNKKLEKPETFAIYCYDEICENDIYSAKETGLDIILVITEKYEIDYSNRTNLVDINEKEIKYIKSIYSDDTHNRRI